MSYGSASSYGYSPVVMPASSPGLSFGGGMAADDDDEHERWAAIAKADARTIGKIWSAFFRQLRAAFVFTMVLGTAIGALLWQRAHPAVSSAQARRCAVPDFAQQVAGPRYTLPLDILLLQSDYAAAAGGAATAGAAIAGAQAGARAAASAALNATATKRMVRHWVAEAGEAWSAGGIVLRVRSVRRVRVAPRSERALARVLAASGAAAAAGDASAQRRVRAALPGLLPPRDPAANDAPWRVAVLHSLPGGMCGAAATAAAADAGTVFVRELGCDARVSVDVYDTLTTQAVTIAHELGHTLGLVDRTGGGADCNLMSGAVAGVEFGPEQLTRFARHYAKLGRPYHAGQVPFEGTLHHPSPKPKGR